MNYAVIFAGGTGQRMRNSAIPKQFIEIEGKPILLYTLLNFERHPAIDGICVVCVEGWIDRLMEMLEQEGIRKVKWLTAGAQTGQQSIYNGLHAIYQSSTDPGRDVVLISDGVRPFVRQEVISANIDCVRAHGSSVTVCPVPETIVEVDDLEEIQHIPKRSQCYLSKAPQGFYLKDIMDAHHQAMAAGHFDCTNSAELMKRYGYRLYVVPDSDDNIKVTTPVDLLIMQALLQNEAGRTGGSQRGMYG